jgi:hypothetical protein
MSAVLISWGSLSSVIDRLHGSRVDAIKVPGDEEEEKDTSF